MALYKGSQKAEKLSMAANDAASAQQSIKALREKVDRQAILLEGIWQLLKSKQQYTDDDLDKLVVEMEEKIHDGTRVAPECPSCGRPLQENTPVCVYCGEEHNLRSLF
jgi:DNA repair exonuclease SbcCD ATPase subunit